MGNALPGLKECQECSHSGKIAQQMRKHVEQTRKKKAGSGAAAPDGGRGGKAPVLEDWQQLDGSPAAGRARWAKALPLRMGVEGLVPRGGRGGKAPCLSLVSGCGGSGTLVPDASLSRAALCPAANEYPVSAIPDGGKSHSPSATGDGKESEGFRSKKEKDKSSGLKGKERITVLHDRNRTSGSVAIAGKKPYRIVGTGNRQGI